MYIKRQLEKQIQMASRYFSIVMICGQRQAGKSDLLNHICGKKRRYVTLDDGDARQLAERDPALFFETYGYPLWIDEFQRVPALMREMERLIEEKVLAEENCNGMFWVSGSLKSRMMQDISPYFAGRVATFDLTTFSAAELAGREAEPFSPEVETLTERQKSSTPMDIHQVYEEIFRGSMPKLRTTNTDRARYYSDYINTFMEKDMKELSGVGKTEEFYDFLVCMAARTGRELNYTEIARAVGISVPTAKAWVNLLVQGGLIYLLMPYEPGSSKRQVKVPKFYFLDTGLAAYLGRWPDARTLETGAANEAFFETYVVSEIVKSYLGAWRQPPLYYYRDIDKKEIDLLLIKEEKLFPIEIRRAKEPALPFKNSHILEQYGKEVQPGLILCMSDELHPAGREFWDCPVSVLL